MAEATTSQLNKFVAVVDKFKGNFVTLNSTAFRSSVYASGNSALISDYETAAAQSRLLNATIDNTVGAWNAAKQSWGSVTDTTSTVIGDAIDEIRSWFGRSATGDLGALPLLPAAVWVVGITASAYTLNKIMDKIFIAVEASKIQRDNPSISRERAITIASDAIKGSLFGIPTGILFIAGGIGLYLLFAPKGKK